ATGGLVQVRLTCGSLDLATTPGDAWHVEGLDNDVTDPTIETTASTLIVRPRDTEDAFAFTHRSTWHISVLETPVLAVDVQVAAGSATMALGAANLANVDVQLD